MTILVFGIIDKKDTDLHQFDSHTHKLIHTLRQPLTSYCILLARPADRKTIHFSIVMSKISSSFAQCSQLPGL